MDKKSEQITKRMEQVGKDLNGLIVLILVFLDVVLVICVAASMVDKK
jgi:hypothetical protein